MNTVSTLPRTAPAPSALAVAHPAFGLNGAYLRTEIRRQLRNRKSLMFSVIMPVVLDLSVGLGVGAAGDTWVGHGNVLAVIMLGMVLYGTITTSTAAGAAVSLEMAQGWVRTLNLTPLSPASYVATKAIAGMVAGAAPVLAVTAAGLATGARAETGPLVVALLVAWAAGALFSVLGLVIGLALPADMVGNVMGLLMTVLGFAGNLFIPLQGIALEIGRFSPLYGVNALVHWPISGQVELLPALLGPVVWTAVFALVAARLFRRRTQRV